MKRVVWIVVGAIFLGLLMMVPRAAASPADQAVPTVTGTPSGPMILVPDQVNVRKGPSITYDQIGVLISGQTASAVGRSPGGEWIQIVYPGAPGDLGWVFSPLVRLEPAGATLPVVEPPPLPTPRITATIDPTLAAQFVDLDLAPTRLPTYTPAMPVPQTTFEAAQVGGRVGLPPILAILGLFVVGAFGTLISVLRGR